jgi:thiamine-phosphate diphosphorylase
VKTPLFERRRPLLVMVTDRRRYLPQGGADASVLDAIAARVEAAARASIDLVHIRERELPARVQLELIRACVEIAHGSDTLIVVNDRTDVALAGGADGVHLRAASLTATAVRGLVASTFVIGRSVHGADEARMEAAGTDYLAAGTVFPSRSKSPGSPLLGPAGLAAVVAAVSVPVLAIGGLTPVNAPLAAGCGAAGAAAIECWEAAFEAGDLRALVAAFRAAFPSREDHGTR